jgi:hypothetical protein
MFLEERKIKDSELNANDTVTLQRWFNILIKYIAGK